MERLDVQPNIRECAGGRKREKLARLLACGVFAVGAIGCENEEREPSPPAFTYDGNASEATPPDIPGPLTEMTIVVIGDPTRERKRKFSDERSITEVFRDADLALSETTDNEISLPNDLSIEYLEVTPTKKVDGMRCYDHRELKAVDARVSGDGVLALLDETPGCLEIPAKDGFSASAWAYDDTKTAVFGNKSPLLPGIINHELGHILGLTHHTEICQRQKEGEPYVFNYQEIGERLDSSDFDVARRRNGSVDEYAATTSVMGNGRGGSATEVYHPLELAKIKDDVHAPFIGVEPSEYSINIHGEGNRGLKLALPDDHPLRKVDADMKAVSFSTALHASPGGGEIDQIRVLVTAESPHMLYDIYALPPVRFCTKSHLCGENIKGWRPVYRDAALGVEVQVRWSGKEHLNLRTVEYS